jgi:hypothetical protein
VLKEACRPYPEDLDFYERLWELQTRVERMRLLLLASCMTTDQLGQRDAQPALPKRVTLENGYDVLGNNRNAAATRSLA